MPGFHALQTPTAPFGEGEAPTTVRDIGTLTVTSGFVTACDPFAALGEGDRFAVPIGQHPVRVTIADVSDEKDGSHLREAYLSLILSEAEIVRVEPAVPDGVEDTSGENLYCVGVDAGTVAFVDSEAATTAVDSDTDWQEVFEEGDDAWFDLMDSPDHYFEGVANIALPTANNGENVTLAHSGWGDGLFPVIASFAENGTLTGLHIDLEVLGEYSEDDDNDEDDEDEADAEAGRSDVA
ncbi:DUF4241 domain-containing protein [Williamsia sp. CHRR-6]|uniref:DUF4241 domain-containing protein n=1 Tax=Williamsia sp. CHRR-6 TaxID=2835871 RepID=UPI001BDABBB4|nr:DUF4241 domain-containing protein [Williamsia sp. CHRR-6]MBT0566525.1 DUF4241 domain-containing protein [Williamsia sp. CHRR-6]